ncbi:MAG: CCA tRNA nucleotidyltransferase [candidate division Zixibacteria bacterium]|nr:CCA tRNA nucleotidyltransferase [candidate division Zixibacteria bacterium]
MCRLSQKAVDDILRKGRIYEVGGAVRDRFLDRKTPVKDRDYLVTGIPYDELTRILKQHGRVDLVGRSFGVIKFTQFRHQNPFTFDITLPRREHSVGVGHRDFDVSFDPGLSVEDDLARRDFTINAMALEVAGGPDGEALVDPLHGMVDMEKRQLRMTSPSSFEEDPLRMMRAVQFAARFEFVIEADTFAALQRHAGLITSVSAERIAEEINKLLTLAERPSEGFRLMQTSGLMKHVLPELEVCVGVEQPGGFHAYDVFEHILRTVDACPTRLRLRLAALFHDVTKPRAKRPKEGGGATFYGHEVTGARVATEVMTRLRYPKDMIRDVCVLIERHMFTTGVTDKGLRRLVRRVGVELIYELLDLRRADVIAQGMGGTTEDVDEFEANIRDELLRKPPFGYSDLALNGDDIMAMFKLAPSREVGEILDYLMEKVLDNPEDNTRDILETYAREFHKSQIEANDIGSCKETD